MQDKGSDKKRKSVFNGEAYKKRRAAADMDLTKGTLRSNDNEDSEENDRPLGGVSLKLNKDL